MEKCEELKEKIKLLSEDLRYFVELSLHESDGSWGEWIGLMDKQRLGLKCWEIKQCKEQDCPAYMSACDRCWLIAGTLCGGEVQGKFALKYKKCSECDVYKGAVLKDPMSEIHEHIVTLVHNLKTKQEDLRNLATRDQLTGLFNRNYFNISIEREIEKVRRMGGKPMLIMIDINNFKYVNDTYGHLQGDKVLKESAIILNNSVRASDLLVRLGGDEFLILLPSVTGDEKDALLKRLRKNLSDWNRGNATLDYKLSFSIGHATLEADTDFVESMRHADENMYKDKMKSRSSRNNNDVSPGFN